MVDEHSTGTPIAPNIDDIFATQSSPVTDQLISVVARGLTRVALLGVGFLGLAYFLGWIRAQGYYDALGAPWMVPLLRNTELLAFSQRPIFLIGFWFIMTMPYTTEHPEAWSKGYLTSCIIFAAGSALLAGAMFAARNASPSTIQVLLDVVLAAWTICFLFAVRSMVELHRHVRTPSKRYLVTSYSFTLALGLLVVPYVSGSLKGGRDRDPKRTTLSPVQLSEEPDSLWYLVRVSESAVYVVNLNVSGEPRFAIRDQTDLGTIFR